MSLRRTGYALALIGAVPTILGTAVHVFSDTPGEWYNRLIAWKVWACQQVRICDPAPDATVVVKNTPPEIIGKTDPLPSGSVSQSYGERSVGNRLDSDGARTAPPPVAKPLKSPAKSDEQIAQLPNSGLDQPQRRDYALITNRELLFKSSDVSELQNGVRIEKVDQQSVVRGYLCAGDVILSINGDRYEVGHKDMPHVWIRDHMVAKDFVIIYQERGTYTGASDPIDRRELDLATLRTKAKTRPSC